MIMKGCVIFERTLLPRKKSHNLACFVYLFSLFTRCIRLTLSIRNIHLWVLEALFVLLISLCSSPVFIGLSYCCNSYLGASSLPKGDYLVRVQYGCGLHPSGLPLIDKVRVGFIGRNTWHNQVFHDWNVVFDRIPSLPIDGLSELVALSAASLGFAVRGWK